MNAVGSSSTNVKVAERVVVVVVVEEKSKNKTYLCRCVVGEVCECVPPCRSERHPSSAV